MLLFLWQIGSWILGTVVLGFIGWLVKRRYHSKRLKSVWVELALYGLVVYGLFTVGMTFLTTWERANNELASFRDDFEPCRDPAFRKRKAKAGSSMCEESDKHHDKTTAVYMMGLLHEMGILKVVSGFSLTELFVNLTESSYWTFVIVMVMTAVVFSVLLGITDMYSASKAPKLDWSNFEIRDKTASSEPGPTLRETCRDLGNGKEACLPVAFK
jgi:hypothetical protein